MNGLRSAIPAIRAVYLATSSCHMKFKEVLLPSQVVHHTTKIIIYHYTDIFLHLMQVCKVHECFMNDLRAPGHHVGLETKDLSHDLQPWYTETQLEGADVQDRMAPM